MKGIHPEAPKITKGKAKVELSILHQHLLLVLVENGKDEPLHLRFVQRAKARHRGQRAIDAQHGG